MTELKELLNAVIRSGFLELIDEDIQIEYKDLEDALSDYGELKPEGYYIEVDTSVKSASVDVKKGVIASELSHIVQDRGMSKWEKFEDKILYKISKKYKRSEERNTDLTTIIRGFGRELYEAMKFAEDKEFPYYREDGLSIRELEALLDYRDKL